MKRTVRFEPGCWEEWFCDQKKGSWGYELVCGREDEDDDLKVLNLRCLGMWCAHQGELGGNV